MTFSQSDVKQYFVHTGADVNDIALVAENKKQEAMIKQLQSKLTEQTASFDQVCAYMLATLESLECLHDSELVFCTPIISVSTQYTNTLPQELLDQTLRQKMNIKRMMAPKKNVLSSPI
jgi:hypothetical protein